MNSSFIAVARPGLFRSSAWLLAWQEAWASHPEIQCFNQLKVFDKGDSDLQGAELQTLVFKINEPLFSFFPLVDRKSTRLNSSH